ncbi:hypothetical protein [Clostridium sp. ZS2-4]|uniref:hypothetical protein n=1 Tax=Clostridium sp. ZS2-4 TaxID=2987703 RepID=UPI00227AC781|nr:hypothetical protein [Clostridium sp. ZS2-4]MCY6355989.1 hypothetical protein [Clostridium sp. ZS2-4]
MKDIYEKFRLVLKYRDYCILSLFGVPISYYFYYSFSKLVGSVFFLISVILAFKFANKYRCPVCNYKFDIRESFLETRYCPKCGKELQD